MNSFEGQSNFIREELSTKDDALDVVYATRTKLAQSIAGSMGGPKEVENKTRRFMDEVSSSFRYES